MQKIQGILFDLDGVFYVGQELIPGGNKTLEWLQTRGVPYRFVTNNTTLSRSALSSKLQRLGLDVTENELLSANYAGVLQLRKLGLQRSRLVLRPEAKIDYPPTVEENPEAIVIGDIGNRWDYDLLNELMNQVLEGAQIVALHKGRYFQTEQGLQLDSGAFVVALEHATGQKAHVVGKPSAAFFTLATQELGCNSDSILMVGDDLINDIQGAQKMGYQALLVQTGKYRAELVKKSNVRPDGILASIRDLPAFLSQNHAL